MNPYAWSRAKGILLAVMREGVRRSPKELLEVVIVRLKGRGMRRHPFLDWLTNGWNTERSTIYQNPTLGDIDKMIDELAAEGHRVTRIRRSPKEPSAPHALLAA